MPMKTIEGYSKEKYTDTSVLLAGGGAKALSEFIGALTWDNTNKKIKYTPVGGSATDLVTLSWDNISGKPDTFAPGSHNHDDVYLKLSGGTVTDVLTLKAGTYAANASNTYPGGSYAAVEKPNLRLIGDSSKGLSTIEFLSQKGNTSINKPSDCAFIQFQPYGTTTQSAVGTQPTLGTSGEANRLVIGVNNDANDYLVLQTPATTGLKHAVAANLYTIWDEGNDGSGSGLDADTLDGYHASDFLGHTHEYIKGPDNRSTNRAPSWYMTNPGSASVYTEFAQEGGAISSTFENRVTFTPWNDNSGQRPVQLAFNNSGMYIRTAASDSSWNSWNTIIHSGNISSQTIGNADTVDNLHARNILLAPYLYHDLFTFGNHFFEFYSSSNGTSFTKVNSGISTIKQIFNGLGDDYNLKTYKAVRFVFSDLAWAGGQYLIFQGNYSTDAEWGTETYKVETSSNNSSWSEVASGTLTCLAGHQIVECDISGNNYLRITFTQTGSGTKVGLNNLRYISGRLGNQGGTPILPYTWNNDGQAFVYYADDADTLDGKHASEFASNTHSHSGYVTTSTDQEISGIKTFDYGKWKLKASESNEIVNKTWGNSTYYKPNDSAVVSDLASITNAIRFRWYSDYYDIGIIRGSSAASYGFGIGKENSAGTHVLDLFRVNVDGTGYLNGNEILTTASSITADSVAWANITGKPSSFTPASHTHDTYVRLTGDTMSGTLQFSSTMPFQFLGCGNETYTRSVMYADTDGITFETPRATNASNGTILPFMVKTRGGQYAPIQASGFKKDGSDDTYVLLGGGGQKPLSEFASDVSAFVKWGGNQTSLGSGTPVNNAQNWVTAENLPNGNALVYNSSGAEYSLLYSFTPSSRSYGTILRWGYTDRYLYITRRNNNSWTDGTSSWSKIYAGYADSAGSAGYADSADSADTATEANYLSSYSLTDVSQMSEDLKLRWYAPIVRTSTTPYYAGKNYGFPADNNANGVLWLGTHSGNYGGQLGVSSNGSLYYRFISNNTFPTDANGASWQVLLTSKTGIAYYQNYLTNPNLDTFADSPYLLTVGETGNWGSGTKPTGISNANGVFSMHTHTGNYYSQLLVDTQNNHLWVRSAYNTTTWGNWLPIPTIQASSTLADDENKAVAVTANGNLQPLAALKFNQSSALNVSTYTGALFTNSSASIPVFWQTNSSKPKHSLVSNFCAFWTIYSRSASAFGVTGFTYVENFTLSSVSWDSTYALLTLTINVPNVYPYYSSTTVYEGSDSVSSFPAQYQVIAMASGPRSANWNHPEHMGWIVNEYSRTMSSNVLTIKLAVRQYSIDNAYTTDNYIRNTRMATVSVLIGISETVYSSRNYNNVNAFPVYCDF